MTDDEWTPLLVAGAAERPTPIGAETFLQWWPSSTNPVAVSCSDERVYVIKGKPGIERQLVAEHVVGRLAPLIGAPVPEISRPWTRRFAVACMVAICT